MDLLYYQSKTKKEGFRLPHLPQSAKGLTWEMRNRVTRLLFRVCADAFRVSVFCILNWRCLCHQ